MLNKSHEMIHLSENEFTEWFKGCWVWCWHFYKRNSHEMLIWENIESGTYGKGYKGRRSKLKWMTRNCYQLTDIFKMPHKSHLASSPSQVNSRGYLALWLTLGKGWLSHSVEGRQCMLARASLHLASICPWYKACHLPKETLEHSWLYGSRAQILTQHWKDLNVQGLLEKHAFDTASDSESWDVITCDYWMKRDSAKEYWEALLSRQKSSRLSSPQNPW